MHTHHTHTTTITHWKGALKWLVIALHPNTTLLLSLPPSQKWNKSYCSKTKSKEPKKRPAAQQLLSALAGQSRGRALRGGGVCVCGRDRTGRVRRRRVEGQVRVRGVGGCWTLGGGLAVAKKSDRKVFDVSRPLGGQLEELNVVPLNAVYGHCRDTDETQQWGKKVWQNT